MTRLAASHPARGHVGTRPPRMTAWKRWTLQARAGRTLDRRVSQGAGSIRLGHGNPQQPKHNYLIWAHSVAAASMSATRPIGGSVRFADVEGRSRGVKRRPRPRDSDRRARRSQIGWGWPPRWPAFARAGSYWGRSPACRWTRCSAITGASRDTPNRLTVVSGCALRRDGGPGVPGSDEFAGPCHLVERSNPDVNLPGGLLALLRQPSPCYLATLMPDGSPQLTQTWVDTDGEHILSTASRDSRRSGTSNVTRASP